MTDILQIGPAALPSRYLLFVLAFFTSQWLSRWLFKSRLSKPQLQANLSLFTWFVFTSLVLSKLSFVAQYFSAYHANLISILFIWQPGFSWHWGISLSIVGFAAALMVLPSLKRQVTLTAALMFALQSSILLAAIIASQFITNSIQSQSLGQLQLKDIQNNKVLIRNDGQGKIINFWASWCGPCIREMPMLGRLHPTLEQQGVQLYLLNMNESAELVNQFLQKRDLQSLPIVLSDQTNIEELFYQLGGQVTPTTLFVSPDGKIINYHIGELSAGLLLEQAKLINKPTP